MKVLYVEDNEDIGCLFVASKRLTIGLETVLLLASDGQEAVQFGPRAKPDIIFVDEELPVVDGIMSPREVEEAVLSALDPQCLPMSGLAASGGRLG